MKKILALSLSLLLVLSMSACASVFAKEYYDSYPFVEEGGGYELGDQDIRSYPMLKAAILEMIGERCEQAVFRFGSYSGSLIDDLAAVCVEIKNEDPLGAYAVESIGYDTSRIVSYYTAEISISYKKSAGEIAGVQSVSGMGGFALHLRSIMEDYGSSTVVKVYSSAVNEEYIIRLVSDYCSADPLLAVVEPTVSVSAYPDSGADRIYEIGFDYGLERQQLLQMDALLSSRVEDLAASLGEGDALSLALRCAQSLSDMVKLEQVQADHPGTAYGSLVEGSDDPLGLAMAYKALCDRLGLECMVVRGELSSHAAEDHAWNIICLDGEYYHVDVSRFDQRAFLLSDEDIRGDYYWDKPAYPRCQGSLGPEDVFEPLPEENPDSGAQPEPEPQPDSSPEPQPDTGPEGDGGEGGGEQPEPENGEENN